MRKYKFDCQKCITYAYYCWTKSLLAFLFICNFIIYVVQMYKEDRATLQIFLILICYLICKTFANGLGSYETIF